MFILQLHAARGNKTSSLFNFQSPGITDVLNSTVLNPEMLCLSTSKAHPHLFPHPELEIQGAPHQV